MVDKVSFIDQNYPNNIVLCQKHQNKCKIFKLDSQFNNNIFKCHTCMIQEKQDYSQIVPLSQACSSNTSTIILSWPPLDDQTLLQKVFEISQQSYTKQTESDKIVQFFDQFTTQIIQKINEKKKIILTQAENYVDSSSQIQQVYQQIANLQELKEIIQDDKINITKKSKLISNFIQKKNSEKSQNTLLIKQCLQEQNIPKFFDHHVFNSFKNNLISQIEQLDYHNQTLIKDFNCFSQQFLSIQNSFNNSNQVINNIENQQDSNLDRIIKLISNKSNSCNQKYLDSVKLELNKLSSLINMLNIDQEMFVQNKQQISIDFNSLECVQIENIQILIDKMRELNKQQNEINNNINKDILSQQLQPSSFFVMEKIFKGQQLMTQQMMIKIENLLRKYPIFEIEQLNLPIKYDFKIELSKYNNSQTKGKISIDNDGFQNFEVISSDNSTPTYIKINQDCRYRIRIKLHLKNQNKIFFICLVKDQDKDYTSFYESNKVNSFSSYDSDYGVSKVIKGQCLRKMKYPEEYSEIEVRFCVKERLFEVCDYPKRENINTINDDKINMLDPNYIYYLGLQLYHTGDKITILEFEEEKILE